MRIVLASLVLAAGLASAAQAQDQTPAAPATPPTTVPATQPAAPATQAPATTPPATTATPPTTPPAATTPAPDVTATPTPAPGEPPPALPTTGDGAVVISFIEKVCVPMVRGSKLDDLAKPFGMKLNRRDGSWSMPLGTDKNYTLTVFPAGANKDVCRADVHYAIGQDKPIVGAINIWSFLHQPELILQANYVNTDADGIKRVRKSWEHLDSASSTAVNFSTLSKPDGTSLNNRFDSGEIYYQERKF
jgi:hypothetical protein